MGSIVHVPQEGNSLIARAPDGTLVNLRTTQDGTLLVTDPLSADDYNTSYSYSYDGMGRLVAETRIIDGTSFVTTYTYDNTTGSLLNKSLDPIPDYNPVLSVAGKGGVVELAPVDIGLGNLDNVPQEYYTPGGQVGEYLDGGQGRGSRQWRRLDSDNVAEGVTHLYFTDARKAELLALMGASAPVAVWYTKIFSNVTTPNTNGVRVDFALDSAPGSPGHVDVAKNGLTLALYDDYTIVGSTLTMAVAPLTSDKLAVRYGASLPVGTTGANAVSVLDAGGYYSGTDQESVNEQVGRFIIRVIAAFAGLGITVVNS